MHAPKENAENICAHLARYAFAGHPQAEFDKMPGVVSSSVGYTGGTAPDPTYRSVCSGDGHTEALRLVYDPNVLSYEALMEKVFKGASPHRAKAQYMSAVWAQTPEQAAAAKRVAEKMKKGSVPVLPASETKWHDAEEYHQKYIAKAQKRPIGIAAVLSANMSL